MEQNIERVVVYVDGFNLFYGIKDSGYHHHLWLNLSLLVTNLLKGNQRLVCVKYFTTKITNDISRRNRQKLYLDALSTLPNVEVYYGKFQEEKINCRACRNEYVSQSEKMTDVNIAVHMINDAHLNLFDSAMLISGDTDHIPQIKMINENFKNKRVFVAFPPNRANDEVKIHANGSFVIGRKKLKDSQFDAEVIAKDGTKYIRPLKWTDPAEIVAAPIK